MRMIVSAFFCLAATISCSADQFSALNRQFADIRAKSDRGRAGVLMNAMVSTNLLVLQLGAVLVERLAAELDPDEGLSKANLLLAKEVEYTVDEVQRTGTLHALQGTATVLDIKFSYAREPISGGYTYTVTKLVGTAGGYQTFFPYLSYTFRPTLDSDGQLKRRTDGQPEVNVAVSGAAVLGVSDEVRITVSDINFALTYPLLGSVARIGSARGRFEPDLQGQYEMRLSEGKPSGRGSVTSIQPEER